jgi:hypothetical protein
MCTMNWGHMLWTLIDAPTLFVSRALSETRTTRDLRHPATTNTRYYSQTRYLQRNTTSPLLHSTSAPRTSRLPHKPKPQVLLLRFPPPLRSRGALPRCIPPRALSPYQACDRTLFQRPSYRSRSTPLSLQLDLFARTIGDVLSHFVRAVERVLSNSKRVELTPVRLENGFSAITDYTLLLRPPLAHAHAHEHTTRRLPHLNLHSRGEPKP